MMLLTKVSFPLLLVLGGGVLGSLPVLATPLSVQFPAAVQASVPDRVVDRQNYRETILPASLMFPAEQTPRAMIHQIFGLPGEPSESGSETLEILRLNDRQTVAILTRSGLMDDSVRAIRYRVELETQAGASQTQWKVLWAGQQFQCQVDRGQQSWAGRACL